MEIASPKSTWPLWIEVGDRRFELRYERRQKDQHDSYMGSQADWWMIVDVEGRTLRASGDGPFDAAQVLAYEIRKLLGTASRQYGLGLNLASRLERRW